MALVPEDTKVLHGPPRFAPELQDAHTRHGRRPEPDCFSGLSEAADAESVGPSPSVSVIVTTSRNPSMLERCVRSILECDYDDFEVIVVDVGPPSLDTPRMLVKQFPGELRLRYVEEPWSPASAARNATLARVEAEIVAFTGDDVIVDPLWLRAGVRALRTEDGVVCVAPLSLPRDAGTETDLPERVVDLGNGLERRIYRLRGSRNEDRVLPYKVGALSSSASMLMLTEVVRELGGFDPALGPATPTCAGENLDLLLRVVRKGYALAYEPRAVIWRDDPSRGRRSRRRAWADGIGLGAILTKQLIAGPQRRALLRTIPGGLRCVSAGPAEDIDQPSKHPRHLRWLTRLGMLVGPIAYLASALIVWMRRLMGKRTPRPRSLRIVRRMIVGGEGVNVVWFRQAGAPPARFAWRRDAGVDVRSSPQPGPAYELPIIRPATNAAGTLRVSAIVPTRNAEEWIESCLRAIRDNDPAEVILVDGGSTDRTVELAQPWVDQVIDDGGAGVAAARMLGVASASQPWIALVDADVVLPPNALRDLDRERHDRQLVAVQAGLHSVGAGDYWSQALADHHNRGRSKNWFGVCASLIPRDVLLAHPLDGDLRSGEDIDLRIRLTRAGFRIGVSESMVTQHRFANGFTFAGGQWIADGAGLGRMVRKHGRSALVSAMIPFGAAALGMVRGMRDALRSWPYFVGFAVGNYIGLWRGLVDRSVPARGLGRWLIVAGSLLWLLMLPALLAAATTILTFLMIRLGHAAYQGRLLAVTLGILVVAIPFEVGRGGGSGRFAALSRHIAPFAAWAVLLGLVLSGLRLARVVGL